VAPGPGAAAPIAVPAVASRPVSSEVSMPGTASSDCTVVSSASIPGTVGSPPPSSAWTCASSAFTAPALGAPAMLVALPDRPVTTLWVPSLNPRRRMLAV